MTAALSDQYEVAVSYAREDGAYVSEVVADLRSHKVSLFFDRSEEIELWGKDLYQELAEVYGSRAICCVMFLSRWYAEKVWTNYERRAIQRRALETDWRHILPARLDQAEIPGFPPGISFLDVSEMAPEDLAQTIIRKLELLRASAPRAAAMVPETVDLGKRGRYQLVRLTGLEWVGGGALALLDGEWVYQGRGARWTGREIRFATITSGFEGLTDFVGTSCAISCDITPRLRHAWVKVDEIRVRVNSYEPLRPYELDLPLPYEEAHVFYVEIHAERRTYRADYYLDGQRRDVGFVRLFRRHPETIVLRINAPTPGIYNFDVELVCSTRDRRTIIPLAQNQQFLFDHVGSGMKRPWSLNLTPV